MDRTPEKLAAYGSPTLTSVGDVGELTQGVDSGFSDDGGHAGYKKEGGARRPESYEALPPR